MLWKILLVALLCFTFAGGQPDPAQLNALQVQTIRTAFQELGTRVTVTLRIQVGDVSQIQRQQTSSQQFLTSVVEVSWLTWLKCWAV